MQQIFGGIPVVMFEDFAQFPSVKGVSITDVIIKKTRNKITLEHIKKNKNCHKNKRLPLYRSNTATKENEKNPTKQTVVKVSYPFKV